MKKTEEFIENRIRWRADKNNLPTTSCFYFEAIPVQISQELITRLQDRDVGKPILYFTNQKQSWVIIGTRQIAWGNHINVHTLPYLDIAEIMVDDEKKKGERSEVLLIDKTGKKHIVRFQKGQELYRLMNILGMLVNLWLEE